MNSYYTNQAGSGLGGFAGHRYQRGDGFFGRLISGTVLPLIRKALPFLGKTALNTGVDIVRDLSEGQKFKQSFKRRMKEGGEQLTDKAIGKVKLLTGGRLKRAGKTTAATMARTRRRKKSAAALLAATGSTRRKSGKAKKNTNRKTGRRTKGGRSRKATNIIDFL